jgi:hypothetical protein
MAAVGVIQHGVLVIDLVTGRIEDGEAVGIDLLDDVFGKLGVDLRRRAADHIAIVGRTVVELGVRRHARCPRQQANGGKQREQRQRPQGTARRNNGEHPVPFAVVNGGT